VLGRPAEGAASESPRIARWTVDLDRVERALDRLLEKSEAP
jgi:hypothetical protein